ncbi:glycosyltransferase [Legionella spiritensis]|uniref:glycosyltransferase n=1 Tax=Legionella spiritensis TaxID=452 RepID=UPI000F6E864F|nr:glycosyltransferase [Legionella spiritensis]VEG89675.1 Glycosyl transferases group 1 [Legionella spiritensis]
MVKVNGINDLIDAVVMLTGSNWKTELRSNRYHYASRFAKNFPVIFIQPDLDEETFYYEETELDNVVVLHVYSNYYSQLQSELIINALNSKNVIAPLLWIYNPCFLNSIKQLYSPYKIYHATEDYFSPHYQLNLSEDFQSLLVDVINIVDEVICVSSGVMSGLLNKNIKWKDKVRLITNGCDFEFYNKKKSDVKKEDRKGKIAFYQGNIFDKLDFELLNDVVKKLPEWTFQFCGKILNESEEWNRVLANDNVEYLGLLTPEELREVAHQATIGLIPFKKTDYLYRSFPLKAFEYIACSLPVVSTPIEELYKYEDVFLFADNVDEFVNQILLAEIRSHDSYFLNKSAELASQNSYDKKFQKLIEGIKDNITNRIIKISGKSNILFLYESKSLHINTIKTHLESYGKFSSHNVFYASATEDLDIVPDLFCFDAIIIHYSLRLSLKDGNWTISQRVRSLLKNYGGLKIAFIQDEYDTTNIAINWLKDLGIQVVFTCVPEKYIRQVYPSKELPNVHFINNLTGYVPDELVDYPVMPLNKREVVIAYRGRSLPFWYGDLGQEKEFIGKKMKEICLENNIKEDIEWDDSKRIYGGSWYEFIASAKATLGTESGSNVIDFYGDLHVDVANYLANNPSTDYQEIYNLFLKENDGQVKMNQISPKIFEAICLHTALILFEGEYSGVIEPDKHFIPLKKDFSNINDVLSKVNDDKYLLDLTCRAYEDIIASGKYSYRTFVKLVDSTIDSFIPKGRNLNVEGVSKVPYNVEELENRLFKEKISEEKNLINTESASKSSISKIIFSMAMRLSSYAVLRKIKLIITRKIKIFNPLLRRVKNRIIN